MVGSSSPAVLVSLLEHEAVPLEILRQRYGAILELVETLLGVVPQCDPYLEIWPPAFRSYNVMVPSLLNLPLVLWGLGARRSTVGLAMYVASRNAECAYCSAHTCSFALRRGATVEQVAAALAGEGLSEADRAAVAVARALSLVPATIGDAERNELRRHFSTADEAWIVLSVAMMGWLNKTMDALGVPLEDPIVAEVSTLISGTGWKPGPHMPDRLPPPAPPPPPDSLGKRLSVIRHAPKAIGLDKQWTKGVPNRWPAVGELLREKTGHDFPVLGRIPHRGPVRAMATMIRDNLCETVVGREEKLSAGLVYAEVVQNPSLAAQLRAMGAVEVEDSPVQILARAVSPSPAAVDEQVIESCRSLSPAAIVEVVTFVALLQMLHRLESYYPG